jgi:hypothetical protein
MGCPEKSGLKWIASPVQFRRSPACCKVRTPAQEVPHCLRGEGGRVY